MSGHGDGGPAFPAPTVFGGNNGAEWGESGMSLRDYFAGQALAMAGSLMQGIYCEAGVEDEERGFAIAAEVAYKIADAMLAARAATRGGT